MSRKGISKIAVVFSIVGLLLILLVAVFVLPPFVGSPVPVVTLPVPNAYDTMIEAGDMVTGTLEDYAETTDLETLREFVESNSESLALTEQAMLQDGMAPVDYKGGFQAILPDQGVIRQAMRLLLAKGRLAELEGDYGSAASTYAKLFALSNKCANGGLAVHQLISFAGERMGLQNLNEIATKLTPEEKRTTATILSIKRQLIDIKALKAREHAVVKSHHGNLTGTWMILITGANDAMPRVAEVDVEIDKLLREVLDELSKP